MPDPAADTPLAAQLRLAGYDLPAETLAELDRAHPLLLAMLARLGAAPPEAEAATVFHPDRQA
jgi:hypothetical protein